MYNIYMLVTCHWRLSDVIVASLHRVLAKWVSSSKIKIFLLFGLFTAYCCRSMQGWKVSLYSLVCVYIYIRWTVWQIMFANELTHELYYVCPESASSGNATLAAPVTAWCRPRWRAAANASRLRLLARRVWILLLQWRMWYFSSVVV